MKTVLITGGSRGIGKAVAIKFAEKGNQIIIKIFLNKLKIKIAYNKSFYQIKKYF